MISTESLPGPFMVPLPEVYQIELSSVCNLDCIMCPRKIFKRDSGTGHIDFKLVKKILGDGSLNGSYFVEFQMAGEPLLHPQFEEIVEYCTETYPNIIWGMSTNGIRIMQNMPALLKLDYLTISVDSITDYQRIRREGDSEQLWRGISELILGVGKSGSKLKIDLQCVELEGYEKQLEAIRSLISSRCGFVRVRSVPDCFRTIFDKADKYPVKSEPCLNPWLSVSIQCNGNVVPCCFCFGDDIILGNIQTETLREIWEGGRVKKLREQHSTGKYEEICSRCYMRSPVLLHWELFCSSGFIGKKLSNVDHTNSLFKKTWGGK